MLHGVSCTDPPWQRHGGFFQSHGGAKLASQVGRAQSSQAGTLAWRRCVRVCFLNDVLWLSWLVAWTTNSNISLPHHYMFQQMYKSKGAASLPGGCRPI